MREKHRLFAVVLGMLLCSVVPTATYAQDHLERIQEQPQILVEGLVERSDRTEILVTLTEVPPDLVSPSLIAEIHEGTCLDLKSAPVRVTEETAAAYFLTPAVFSLRSFGAVLPVSLAALRSSAHAVTVRAGAEEGIPAFACIDVA